MRGQGTGQARGGRASSILGLTGDRAVLGEGDRAVLGEGDRAVLGEGDRAVLGEGDRAVLGEGDRAVLGEAVPQGRERQRRGCVLRVACCVLRVACCVFAMLLPQALGDSAASAAAPPW